ncbi:MAG: NADPH:quinone reductase [Pseudonocardiales bacterium]|jgi:NADPH2:quinone reductase|nr:NADPH:quinone reductase [Pseudonocardiales bacterium]
MRAIQVVTLDGPRSVQVVDVPEPTPGEGQVVIEVHAAGVTFPDVLLSRGMYQLKPPPPFLLGSEIAGVVRSAPPGAGVQPGDRVAALSWFAGFAELAVTNPDMVFPLPDGVDFAVGAALPINYLTAHFALNRRARLAEGDTVLVHGAAGGVGTASIQYARALGATVIAVASTDDKAAMATRAGAQHTVHPDGFRDAVKELTGGRGVDVVVDPVGGDRFTDSLRCLGPEGRLLVIGFVGGEIPTVKVNRLLLNNTSVDGVAWGEFAIRRPGYLQEQWAELQPLVAAGALAAPIGHRLPLADAAAGLALMDERRAVGKVVLIVRDQ